MTTGIRCLVTGLLAVLSLNDLATAQLPAPKWVQMFDQGEVDPKLKGLRTPRGIKVEFAADSLRSPRALGFDRDGALWLLQHSEGPSPRSAQLWDLVSLSAGDGDGRFGRPEVVLSGLQHPAVLVHEDWIYEVRSDEILRRRRNEPELAAKLGADAADKRGPPTAISSDKNWIEQRLAGISDPKAGERAGGLAAGLDGWIYLSIGGMDNRLISWDGSQAAVLGSGAIFRLQPDGSRVQEFARGFAAPAGPPACDALGVIFQVDRTPTGSRLIHVLEGADYGWRSDFDPPRLDRPGTLPAMLESKSRNPAGALVYMGDAFPKFFQRLLIVSEVDTRTVRAYALKPDGVTFSASEPFALLTSDDRDFQPRPAVQGPDGAIYVGEQRGRILRLTWSGTREVPAIEPAKAAATRAKPADQPLDELLAASLDETNSASARAAALAAACRQWNGQVLDACLKLIEHKDSDISRLAADALGNHLPDDAETQKRMAGAMQDMLLAAPLPARRALYIALGKLGTRLETVPEWIFEATSVTPFIDTHRALWDGHVRAAEMPKGWATELMIGNLEVALFDPNPDPRERQRLKKFVVATAECMRTRELATFLERTIRDERDYFSKLDSPFQARLLAAWPNVLDDPPVRADAVAEWLARHPAAAPEVQQAACATVAKLGTAKPEKLMEVARQLLATKSDAKLRAAIATALDRHRAKDKPGEIDKLVEALRKE